MNVPNTPEESKSRQSEKTKNGTSPTQSLAGVRLRKHSDFQRAYAAARKRQSASMSWFLAARSLPPGPPGMLVSTRPASPHCDSAGARMGPAAGRVGLTAGRVGLTAGRVGLTAGRVGLTAGKVLGKAHERNRIRRRMREALRRHLDLLPEGADLILHPRRVVLTMEFSKLEAEIVRILAQARAEAEKLAPRPSMVSPA
jgi:ribonuclease P protein component